VTKLESDVDGAGPVAALPVDGGSVTEEQ